tara:strand:+ start:189 stop:542 length:354 start_codon:yes stop_codon:yes gene_type:complete
MGAEEPSVSECAGPAQTSRPTGETRYRHVVLFRLHAGVSAAAQEEALRTLRRLGDQPGVLAWTVERSLDERKGTVFVELGTFESVQAFESFRRSDEHHAASRVMREISDWLVGDFWE